MNSKQTKTLPAIFSKPTPSTLEWTKLESLLLALGCNVIEGRARDFLTAIGVKP